MDRAFSKKELNKQKRKKVLNIGLIGLAIVVIFISFNYVINTPIDRERINTAIAKKGSIEASLNASAIVLPEFEEIINSPIQGDIEKVNFSVGTNIKQGESILKLNTEYIEIEFKRKEDQLKLSKIQLKRKRLELEKKLSDLQNESKVKELEQKNMETTVNSAKKLFKVGGGTQEEIDLAELNYRIGELKLDQLKKEISHTKKSNIAEIEELQLNIMIQKKNVDEVKRKIEKSAITSTQDGVITWVNQEVGSSVIPGQVLAKVANLKSYKLEGSISEVYGNQLKTNQKVIVRINKTDLIGHIITIFPSVKNGIITFSISLNEKSHPLLKSQLKAEVFVVKDAKSNTIVLPHGAAFKGYNNQILFVIKDGTALPKNVTTGLTNRDFIEIISGIEEGDEVIISDMDKYQNRKSIRINN